MLSLEINISFFGVSFVRSNLKNDFWSLPLRVLTSKMIFKAFPYEFLLQKWFLRLSFMSSRFKNGFWSFPLRILASKTIFWFSLVTSLYIIYMSYLHELNPSVLRPSLIRSVVGNRRGLSFAGRGEAVGGDAHFH